jgi:hypothetical protein
MEEKNNQSRRKFFERIALLGSGAVVGAGVIYSGFEYENQKTEREVRVLTADNKVVE